MPPKTENHNQNKCKMNMSKLSDEVLRKKINAYNADLNNMRYVLEIPQVDHEPCTETDRTILEEMCNSLAMLTKKLRADVKVHEDKKIEAQRLEEEQEREQRRLEKEAKDTYIRENSIHDQSMFDRLKFRFFNLSVQDPDDPEGLNPASSGPFFENKNEQFKHEIQSTNYKLYSAVYHNSEMDNAEGYMQANLNRGLASQVEENFPHFFFVCFRAVRIENTCKYKSYWICNYNKCPSTLFPEFEFREITEKSLFCALFMKIEDEQNISEIYAR